MNGQNTYYRGKKQYELSNHLGNVLVTVSDRKRPVDTLFTYSRSAGTYKFEKGYYTNVSGCDSFNSNTTTAIADFYNADVITAQDYYPFGSPMSGRRFNSMEYKWGFNGMEKDDEIYGAGNANTAMFWEYDTRLGRRWNIDPVVKEWESSYMCFSDNPIFNIDPFGEDAKKNTDWFVNNKTGEVQVVPGQSVIEGDWENIGKDNMFGDLAKLSNNEIFRNYEKTAYNRTDENITDLSKVTSYWFDASTAINFMGSLGYKFVYKSQKILKTNTLLITESENGKIIKNREPFSEKIIESRYTFVPSHFKISNIYDKNIGDAKVKKQPLLSFDWEYQQVNRYYEYGIHQYKKPVLNTQEKVTLFNSLLMVIQILLTK